VKNPKCDRGCTRGSSTGVLVLLSAGCGGGGSGAIGFEIVWGEVR
jgi:hypothetical protein